MGVPLRSESLQEGLLKVPEFILSNKGYVVVNLELKLRRGAAYLALFGNLLRRSGRAWRG